MVFQKKTMLAIALLIAGINPVFSQHLPSIFNEPSSQKLSRMKWWADARFGMFIHWGLYSLGARHEWLKHNEHMTNEEYQRYFE